MLRSIFIVFVTVFLYLSTFYATTTATGTTITTGNELVIQQRFQQIENDFAGRLGVSALNTQTGGVIQYRANEKFPFCSTFKLILVAAILNYDSDELMAKRILVRQNELVSWSPITEKQVGADLSVEELCVAAIQYSDNTATNLLLRELGGPDVLNSFARSMGDNSFSLNRWEPELNSAISGDERDTTTPHAMLQSIRELVLGNVLVPARSEQLNNWLLSSATSTEGIRAGVPVGWQVASKTGSGSYGTTNEIAVLWPEKANPIILTIYFTQFEREAKNNRAVITELTRFVTEVLN